MMIAKLERLLAIGGCGLVVAFAGLGLTSTIHIGFVAVALLGFGLMAGCTLYAYTTIKCPKCMKPIGMQFSITYRWRGQGLQCCPFCGFDLDAETGTEEPSQQRNPAPTSKP